MAIPEQGALKDFWMRLKSAEEKGYHVLTMTELRFEGAAPELIEGGSLATDTANLNSLTLILDHGDHFHIYNLSLGKKEIDLTNLDLHNAMNETFATLAMDEMATVGVVGNA